MCHLKVETKFSVLLPFQHEVFKRRSKRKATRISAGRVTYIWILSEYVSQLRVRVPNGRELFEIQTVLILPQCFELGIHSRVPLGLKRWCPWLSGRRRCPHCCRAAGFHSAPQFRIERSTCWWSLGGMLLPLSKCLQKMLEVWPSSAVILWLSKSLKNYLCTTQPMCTEVPVFHWQLR